MAITKNIVDMMGGTIDVQTEQGKGTEFIVCLPFRIQSEKHHTEKIAEDTILPAAGSDFRGKRILLVEDNELNSEIAVELLMRMASWLILQKMELRRWRRLRIRHRVIMISY